MIYPTYSHLQITSASARTPHLSVFRLHAHFIPPSVCSIPIYAVHAGGGSWTPFNWHFWCWLHLWGKTRCVYYDKKVIIFQFLLNPLEKQLFEVRLIALIAAADMSDRDTLSLRFDCSESSSLKRNHEASTWHRFPLTNSLSHFRANL